MCQSSKHVKLSANMVRGPKIQLNVFFHSARSVVTNEHWIIVNHHTAFVPGKNEQFI